MTTRDGICTLEAALGGHEPCPGPACSFWTDVRGREDCVIGDLAREISTRPAVAAHLLRLRDELDRRRREPSEIGMRKGRVIAVPFFAGDTR